MQTDVFAYVPFDETGVIEQEKLRYAFQAAERAIADACEGPVMGVTSVIALERLQEAYLWGGKAIRDRQIQRNKEAPPSPQPPSA